MTGQDSQKRHKVVILCVLHLFAPIWGETSTVPSETTICMASNLADVIMCAKFQDEIIRGYNFTPRRISHFPIDFCMGLTTLQR